MDEKIKEFFLTFGQKSPARNGFHVVWAYDEAHARKLVIAAYGREWSCLYTKADWFGSEAWNNFPAGQIGELR